MPDHPLKWMRTNVPSALREDFTGSDFARPQVYARVYLSENSPDRPWFWTISDRDIGIATGYEPTGDDAMDAVEHIYAGWPENPNPARLKRRTGRSSKSR